MSDRGAFVGRRAERERLGRALARARRGQGSLILLAGEAGIGKTRLAVELAEGPGTRVLWGAAGPGATSAYGPLVASLRSHLRGRPGALDGLGPLRPHLAALIPELGDPAPATDRDTLFEAVCSALAQIAREEPVLLVLDDLQWSDDATLELLPTLAGMLPGIRVLVLAGYRTDGLGREHPLRRLRHELRRAGRLDELVLAPLAEAETAELAAQVLGTAPAPALARAIHGRTQGIPFFAEELARALLTLGALTGGRRGLELAQGGQVPLPDTVRDTVLLSASELSEGARAAAEAAAVAGETFDLELVGGLSSVAGLRELSERGLIREDGRGGAAFRHALTRETLYADVPWLQRRALHRRMAEKLAAAGGPSMEVATHWLGARDDEHARNALLAAAAEARAVHAHRDAARAGRQALELWAPGEEEGRRIEALESYAASAELAGELAEAALAWREICAIRAGRGERLELADAQRRLAAVQDMRRDRESATAARRAAAEAYAAAGRPAEAAVERLAIADYLRAASRHTAAIASARAAGKEAAAAERVDLRARALGLEGASRATRGDVEGGLATVQAGLALALEHGLTPVAAELYQRLSVVLYDAADYRRAEEVLETAVELCRLADQPVTEALFVNCLIYVLRERGEWARSVAMGRDLIAADAEASVAEGLIGVIHAYQGAFGAARRLLVSSLATSVQVDDFTMIVDSSAGLAWIAAVEGDDDEATRLSRSMLARWQGSEDHHVSVRGLRWSAGYLARRGDLAGANAAAEALSRIASTTGHADALASLAHAIGETALAAGDAATAADQLSRAVELHRGLDIPYERAEIELRAGVALAAAGDRELGLERLAAAHRTARKLGARPLAAEAAREVAALGESVAGRLGRRAAADTSGAGLSRRELQVMRLVALGRTNREIAEELFLSPRTVDMHVRSLLRKLDRRSRIEAARRAEELGLLAS
jgi:DNA-binding CsgD family transcriptional regulator